MHLGQRDGGRAETAAHADHHILLGDELPFEEQLEETAPLFFLQIKHFGELLLREQPIGQQYIRNSFAE
jgi:hypothetical protein